MKSKLCVCFILTGLLILFSMSPTAYAVDFMDGRVSFYGWVENQTAFRLEDGVNDKWDLSRMRNTIQLEMVTDISDTLKLGLIGRGHYEAMWDIDSDLDQSPKDRDAGWGDPGSEMEAEMYLREWTIRKYWENLSVTIGAQQIVWGEALFFRMSDFINALDVSWNGNESWENARIPMRAIDAIYTYGGEYNLKFELVLIPEDFQPFRLAPYGSTWYGSWWDPTKSALGDQLQYDAMYNDIEKLRDKRLHNFQGGLRIMANVGGADYSLFYFYQRNQAPVATHNDGFNFAAPLSADNYAVRFNFPFIHQVGGAFNYPLSWTNGMIWGETALTFDLPLSKTSANPLHFTGLSPELKKVTKWGYMLEFDRPQYIRWLNPRKAFSLYVQTQGEIILNSLDDDVLTGWGDEGSASTDTAQYFGVFSISTEYMDGYVKPGCSVVWWFKSGNTKVNPKVDFVLTNDLTISVGAQLYHADNFTDTNYGGKSKSDEIYFHTKMTF